jgi:hypothetical protein
MPATFSPEHKLTMTITVVGVEASVSVTDPNTRTSWIHVSVDFGFSETKSAIAEWCVSGSYRAQ